MSQDKIERLLSSDHFPVDGTELEDRVARRASG
jgi:hypothetical protein